MEVREFVPFLSILASYCYFPHSSAATLFWLMGAIIMRSGPSWWDLNRALSGEMMRALMHRLRREDIFGQVRLGICRSSSVALLR